MHMHLPAVMSMREHPMRVLPILVVSTTILPSTTTQRLWNLIHLQSWPQCDSNLSGVQPLPTSVLPRKKIQHLHTQDEEVPTLQTAQSPRGQVSLRSPAGPVLAHQAEHLNVFQGARGTLPSAE